MSQSANGSAVLWGLPTTRRPEVSLTLWGIGSTRALRVHWMLAELGLPYISHRIQSRTGETMTPGYLKINPRHKIPSLRHGPLLMTESAAIVQYLSERFETPMGFFAPTDLAQRAKVYEWCYFVMNELDGHTLYVIRRHVGLSHIYGEAPTAVESAKTYFREQIEALEPSFRLTQDYLFGEDFSVADILLTTCLEWARGIGIELPASVVAYFERVASRPAYREARRRNDPAIEPPTEARITSFAETI
jgi:glutathione S-transferase